MKDPHVPGSAGEQEGPALPRYEPPTIRILDEEEVLSSFQVTQASLSWWYM